MSEDFAWFEANPGRRYRCRLATPHEFYIVRKRSVIDDTVLQGDRFVHALVRYDRENTVQKIFVAIGALGDMDEADCMARVVRSFEGGAGKPGPKLKEGAPHDLPTRPPPK